MDFRIIQSLLPNQPQNSYSNGSYEGVKVYFTEQTGVMAEAFASGKATFEAFTHYFVDDQIIAEVADPNYTGDDTQFAHVTLCAFYGDGVYIRAAYPQLAYIVAYLLVNKELPIDDNTIILDGAASKYLNMYSIPKERFIQDVQTLANTIVPGS